MAFMNSFIFDSSKGETPETAARKRAIAAQIMGQIGNRPARNVGEGLGNAFASIGHGITANVMNRRADAAETSGREGATTLFNDIVSRISGQPASSGAIPTSEGAGQISATSGQPIDMTGNDVYSGFMDTVRGGVKNPYALAAIAATGKAESGFDPGNVNRTWSDPSESGQAGTAGGIMSWRGPRYQALAATGDLSPQGQANFFLKENPQLIEALNNAQSVEEAQSLMNNAWKFAGYNRPGGEAANRLAAAQGFLPSFQGGAETAALSPDTAFGAVMPELAGGGLSDEVAEYRQTPDYAAQFPGMSAQQFDGRFGGAAVDQPVQGREGLASALAASNQQGVGQRAIDQQTQQMPQVEVAQASQGGQQQNMLGGLGLEQLMQAANNPWLNETQRATVNMLLQQKMQGMDPSRQLDMDYRRAQIEKLNREAANPKGDETFFGNPVAIQNQDGTISYGQIGNKGSFRPIQLGEGQSFAPPTKTVDTPTETLLVDQAGNVISRTPKLHRDAEREKAIGSAEGKVQAETQSEYDSITSKMPGLYGVVDRLSQLAQDATYTAAGRAVDFGRSQLGMEPRDAAVARAEYTAIVDNQILPLLRDTFGAQFTNEEGLRLAKTLGDADKSPTEKAALLRAFIEQKERDIRGLETRLGVGSTTGKTGRSPVNIGGYTIEQVD
jgi:hypothetical protein